MDAMAGARVRVVISIPWASWKSASYMALIGCTVAVLFATAQLWLVPPWKCMPYAQRKTGGVTTCQEIHKQGYLEQEQLYILSVLFHAISCVLGCQICFDTPPHWTLGKRGILIRRKFPIRRRYNAWVTPTPFTHVLRHSALHQRHWMTKADCQMLWIPKIPVTQNI